MALPVIRLNPKLEGDLEFKGRTYSVPFALPGDLVQFQLKRRGRKTKFRVVHIERGSFPVSDIETVTPFCPYFGDCGGCRAQHISYREQVRIKCTPVLRTLADRYQLNDVTPLEAPDARDYRNRMDFAVNAGTIGLRPAGEFGRFVDIDRCEIQSERSNVLLQCSRELLFEYPDVMYARGTETTDGKAASVTDAQSKDSAGLENDSVDGMAPPDAILPDAGVLKYITIRSGAESGVVIFTIEPNASNYARERYGLFVADYKKILKNEFPEFSLVECDCAAPADLSVTSNGRVLLGQGAYTERLGGREFQVPYDAFFQPNPAAFDLLLKWCRERLADVLDSSAHSSSGAPDQPAATLLDLFCGAGVLSAILTDFFPHSFQRVIGMESVPSAVERASQNFAHFMGEAQFHCVDLFQPDDKQRELLRTALGNPNLELVVMDPPRAGLGKVVCDLIRAESRAPYILYISCNPESQFRDLEQMDDAYEVIAAQPVDCYPHNAHLEQAVLLQRRG
ncbi:MAG: class I SAM-dependent RNA methyltransferase [Leptospiraceae bacterium]|nr:class I SAM-dependent RNA methyltransferase [Leptospiraceae bacterium]